MIAKTSGIVLRIDPFSRTSQVVTWLTPDYGRTVTLAKGALRRRSLFLGQFDCFYSCEILFYTRQRSALHILKETSPTKTRDRFREDWKAAACASYLCDLAARLCPPCAGHGEVCALLDLTLDSLDRQGVAIPLVLWFELQLLRMLGFAPQFAACTSCGTGFGANREEPLLFSMSRGGALCGHCAQAHGDATIPIAPDVLAMFRAWQNVGHPQLPQKTVFTRTQQEVAENVLGLFLRYHLDASLASRDIALAVIRSERT
jgi:DNA repair protein RecO (recombination protein O)